LPQPGLEGGLVKDLADFAVQAINDVCGCARTRDKSEPGVDLVALYAKLVERGNVGQ